MSYRATVAENYGRMETSQLIELIEKVKFGTSIEINSHRTNYETIEQYVRDEDRNEIPEDVWRKMVESDTCVKLQIYPRTPVGFYTIHHYDVEKAIEIALSLT